MTTILIFSIVINIIVNSTVSIGDYNNSINDNDDDDSTDNGNRNNITINNDIYATINTKIPTVMKMKTEVPALPLATFKKCSKNNTKHV